MPSNKQRRETTRRNLELQLQQRQAREAQRKRATLIGSIVGSILVIALVVIIIAVAVSGGDGTKKSNDAAGAPSATPSASATSSAPAPAPAPKATPSAPCAAPGKAATASFKGVTVGQAANLGHEPKVASKASTDPTALECADLAIGTGAAALPTSQVTVQYTGVLYKNGMKFDSSWARGQPAQFSLAQVVPGFTQGIGGTGKVSPMRVGGRRIMILPPSLGYGAQAQQSIPANSTLVFVVDLVKIG